MTARNIPAKIRQAALAAALVLLVGCMEDDGHTTEECENGKCDSVWTSDLKIVYKTPVTELSLPADFNTTPEVAHAGQVVHITTEDIRIVPDGRPFHARVFNAHVELGPFALSDSYGFGLRYRPAGTEVWSTTLAHENGYWYDVKVDPVAGKIRGDFIRQRTVTDIEVHKDFVVDAESLSEGPIEYQLYVLVLYNFGPWNDGSYKRYIEISYTE